MAYDKTVPAVAGWGGAGQGEVADAVRFLLDLHEGSEAPTAAVAASGTITATGNPSANDTVTIGTTVYKFVASPAAARDVLIGVSASDTLDNLIAAVTAGTGAGTKYGTGTTAHATATAAAGAGDTVTVTAKTKGAAGNAIALAKSSTNLSVSAATLENGVDGTASPKGAFRVATDYLYIAYAATTISDTSGWRKVQIAAL